MKNRSFFFFFSVSTADTVTFPLSTSSSGLLEGSGVPIPTQGNSFFLRFYSFCFHVGDGFFDVEVPVEQARGQRKQCELVAESGICDGAASGGGSSSSISECRGLLLSSLDLWPRRERPPLVASFSQARARSLFKLRSCSSEVALAVPAEHAPRRRRARPGDGRFLGGRRRRVFGRIRRGQGRAAVSVFFFFWRWSRRGSGMEMPSRVLGWRREQRNGANPLRPCGVDGGNEEKTSNAVAKNKQTTSQFLAAVS